MGEIATHSYTRERRDIIELVVILIISVVVSAMFVWWTQDDFYIHLQYAKHLAASGEWGFNLGAPSYGTSSQIWVILLAGIAVLTRADLFIVAKTLSVLFGALTIVPLVLARKHFTHRWVYYFCILSLLANHWYRLSSGSGMEATLAGLLVTVLFVATLPRAPQRPGMMVCLGVLSAAALLTRPELLFLPLIALLSYDVSREQYLHRVLKYFLGFFIVLLPWLLFSFTEFGTLIPNTVIVKSGGHLDLSSATMWRVLSRIIQFYLPSNGIHWLAIILLGVWQLFRHGLSSGNRLVHVALVFALPILYFVNGLRHGTEIGFRYAAPTIPILILLGSISLDRLVSLESKRERLIVMVCAFIIFAGNASLSLLHLSPLHRSVYYVESVLVKYGKWLHANSLPRDTVACYDVGAIGYYSDRPVLDLVGLNSIEAYRMREIPGPEGFPNWGAVVQCRPRWLVTPLGIDSVQYLGNLPGRFRVIMKDDVRYGALSPDRNGIYAIYLVELVR